MRNREGMAIREHHEGAAPSDQQVEAAAASFSLLSDPTRVRMLWALSTAERDVGTLANLAATSPTAASQHLAKLRLARLVVARRRGRHVLYRLRSGHVRDLLKQALFHAEHEVLGIEPHD